MEYEEECQTSYEPQCAASYKELCLSLHEQQCRPVTQHQCVEVAEVECTQTEERVRSVFMLILSYTIDVITTRFTTTPLTITRCGRCAGWWRWRSARPRWRWCPGSSAAPTRRGSAQRYNRSEYLDQTKNICNQTEKYLQTQCTPVTEEQCATLPSVVCEEVPDQVINDSDL